MGTDPVLFSKIFTLLCSALMGFVSVKTGTVKGKDSTVLSGLCFDWVIPLSMLNSFLTGYDPETARDFGIGCAFAAAAILLFTGISLLLGKALRLGTPEQGSMMFSNAAGISLPLAVSLLGTMGGLYCAPFMAIQNLAIFFVLPTLMAGTGRIEWKRMLLNRSTLAIYAGLLIFFLRIPVPSFVREAISAVGGILGPVSMFMIGMLMGEADFRSLLRRKDLYLVCALRLIAYPLTAIALIALSGITRRFPYTRDILLVTVICVASPAATLVTQMANAYLGQEEGRTAGSLNIMTTLPSLATIPLMVLLYRLAC